MSIRGKRKGQFHCLTCGLESFVCGRHRKPHAVEQHIAGEGRAPCMQCARELLLVANRASYRIIERPIRKLLRTYELLAQAGVVPSAEELRTNRDPRWRARQRRNALVRFVMDLGSIVDALRSGSPIPGEHATRHSIPRCCGNGFPDCTCEETPPEKED